MRGDVLVCEAHVVVTHPSAQGTYSRVWTTSGLWPVAGPRCGTQAVTQPEVRDEFPCAEGLPDTHPPAPGVAGAGRLAAQQGHHGSGSAGEHHPVALQPLATSIRPSEVLPGQRAPSRPAFILLAVLQRSGTNSALNTGLSEIGNGRIGRLSPRRQR